jgi:hypothetical protein
LTRIESEVFYGSSLEFNWDLMKWSSGRFFRMTKSHLMTIESGIQARKTRASSRLANVTLIELCWVRVTNCLSRSKTTLHESEETRNGRFYSEILSAFFR